MNTFEWNEEFVLGIEVMDSTHKEFINLLDLVSDADKHDFSQRLAELVAHTQAHFTQEEKLMQETQFPAYSEHRDEHQRILGELMQFKKRAEKGQISFARRYIVERLPEWFKLHAASMDSALAAHLKLKKAS